MATWEIVLNVLLIIMILAATIGIIIDFREHKDDESISTEDLKKLRRGNFRFAPFLVPAALFRLAASRGVLPQG